MQVKVLTRHNGCEWMHVDSRFLMRLRSVCVVQGDHGAQGSMCSSVLS